MLWESLAVGAALAVAAAPAWLWSLLLLPDLSIPARVAIAVPTGAAAMTTGLFVILSLGAPLSGLLVVTLAAAFSLPAILLLRRKNAAWPRSSLP